jgi:hypothetical protein
VQNKLQKADQMRINEEAVSFSAFSLTKILVAELLRKGVLNREEFILAIRKEIDEQQAIAEPTNQDAATLLAVYCDEIQTRVHPDE